MVARKPGRTRMPAFLEVPACTLVAPGARAGGRNRYWIVRGTIDGRQHEISTGVADPRAAKAAHAEWAAHVAAVRERGEADDAERPMTFAEVADRYMLVRRPRADDVRIYRILQEDALGRMPVSQIGQDEIAQAAARLYPRCAAATRNRNVYVPVAAALHYAAANKWAPYIRVSKEKEKRAVPRAVRQDVMKALISNSDGDLHVLLLWLFRQGWRVSDTLRLTWENVDLVSSTADYHVSKTDEWMVVPLHPEVRRALEARKQPAGRVFPWKDRHELYDALKPLCTKLGIKFTPHMARHTFATELRNGGAELDEIAAAGAWKDIKSVLRYGRVSPTRVRSIIERLK